MGSADSRALPEWIDVSYDRDPFCGLPSVSIAGRYEWDGRTLFARTRYVVVHHIVDQYPRPIDGYPARPDEVSLALGDRCIRDEVRIGHR
ncbi:LpqN/LpqT family lipoprotein [Rhodococcoides fascians]|uniref:LpqN/LpqT family lipoprotein n=1 Tax=Rhodococcoides fascians TaxID=1828 RepID=UPI0012FF86EF